MYVVHCFVILLTIVHASSSLESGDNQPNEKTIETVHVSVAFPGNGQVIELVRRRYLDELDTRLAHGATQQIVVSIFHSIEARSVNYTLNSSPLLLPKALRVNYFDNVTGEAKSKFLDSKGFNCFYAGDNYKHLSNFRLCNGEFEGEISDLGKVYLIKMMGNNGNNELSFTMSPKRQITTPLKCGNSVDKSSAKDDKGYKRFTREVNTKHAPARSNHSTRYIEIFVVTDQNLYNRSGYDLTLTVQRTINIINYASNLYRQMNIYLVLVGYEVWSAADKFPVTGSADTVLTSFQHYRRTEINPHYPNDNAQLFVGGGFDDATIGRGSASICSHVGGAAITADTYVDDWVVAATTMAHELGHNLGLQHDDELPNKAECTCPREDGSDNKCIMYSRSDRQQPIAWSSCSIERVQEIFSTEATDYCLMNLPNALELVESCGNFFVDQGEECDCGPAAQCESNCCEPLTCKLLPEAQCASGECCDKQTCMLKETATPCRRLADSKCDLQEYCDGESEWCPMDTYMLDGMPCSTLPPAYCYHGTCKSRDSQCSYVWGDNTNSSIDQCYTKWNAKGAYFGHCGYNITDSEDGSSTSLIYKPCESDEDSLCGMLQCFTHSSTGVLGLRVYVEYFKNQVDVNNTFHPCQIVTFDVGLDQFDPGIVPEGSVCGDNKWCRSQRCVEAPVIPLNCSCNQNGVCNQHAHCHCEMDFDPHTDCSSPGAGGSVDSGPARLFIITTTSTVIPETPTKTTFKPDTTTELPSTNEWVIPLAVSLAVVFVVVVILILSVIKREAILNWYQKRRSASRLAAKQRLPNGACDTSSKASLTNAGIAKSHGLISKPVLESSTNQDLVLRNIPIRNDSNAALNQSYNNLEYYSKIDERNKNDSNETVPLRVGDFCRQSKDELNVYSECHFSEVNDEKPPEEGAEDDCYEKVSALTENEHVYKSIDA